MIDHGRRGRAHGSRTLPFALASIGALCVIAMMAALLWPRTLRRTHVAADPAKEAALAPLASKGVATQTPEECDGRRAESDPACVHATGIEHDERPARGVRALAAADHSAN